MQLAASCSAVCLFAALLLARDAQALAFAGPPSAEDSAQAVIAAYEDAQRQALEGWTYDERLLCGSAGVHGLMEKRATKSQIPDIPLFRSKGIVLPAGIPLYAGPSFFISKKYKFIYMRQQKSSSSSIIAAITRTFCGHHGVCTDDEFKWETVPRSITDDMWRDYFVFTWVRNPWVRMESSYRFLCEKMLRLGGLSAPRPESDRPCCASFDAFSRDPSVLISACERDTCCAWNRWSANPGWDRMFVPGHLNDQAHIVFTTDGDSIVDFIGRTEHMDDDWAVLLEHINKHTGWHFSPQSPEKKNPAEDTAVATGRHVECLGRKILHLDADTMREVTRVYAMDVLRFQFDVPPELREAANPATVAPEAA